MILPTRQAEDNFVPDESLVAQHCGSGVSTIPDLLVMELAVLGCTSLYAGSWGEWYNTPEHADDKAWPTD